MLGSSAVECQMLAVVISGQDSAVDAIGIDEKLAPNEKECCHALNQLVMQWNSACRSDQKNMVSMIILPCAAWCPRNPSDFRELRL